jgi:Protein of unknown function (DUF2934)
MEKDTETEQRIRERAYQIWIEEGRPTGRDKEHWARAEQELSETTERGPPLQPDQPVGEVKRAQERLQDAGEVEVPSAVGGNNPDDLTR